MKKIVNLMFCGLIATSFLLPNSLYAKTSTKHSVSQRQADMKKLQSVVMTAIGNKFFEQNSYEKIDNAMEQKLNAFPPIKQKEIRDYIENYPDSTGAVQIRYIVVWYMADTLHQRLVTMPKIQTPEIEQLRQKWISDMQRIDEAASKKTSPTITTAEFIEEANAVFKKNGLEEIH